MARYYRLDRLATLRKPHVVGMLGSDAMTDNSCRRVWESNVRVLEVFVRSGALRA